MTASNQLQQKDILNQQVYCWFNSCSVYLELFKKYLFYVFTRLMDPQPNQKPVKLCPMLVAVKMVSETWLKRVIKFST